jgi:hypothetical protein
LRELVKESCAEASYPFKVDSKTWGVTLDDDLRFAAAEFGMYKSTLRTETEELLRKYMREPSIPRATTATTFEMKDFEIAVTVAAPGTGKTRLIDDALRMPLDAKPGEQEHFDYFLRLAVTFNANYGGSYAHPLTARMLLMFFCGTVDESAEKVLRHIDAKLANLFSNVLAADLAADVLDALEALYFDQRGDKLGRTVLLIDEISKALVTDATRVTSERHVYESVVGWLNGGVMAGSQVDAGALSSPDCRRLRHGLSEPRARAARSCGFLWARLICGMRRCVLWSPIRRRLSRAGLLMR